MERLDIALFYLINHARSPFFDAILPFFTSPYAFLLFLFAFLVAVFPLAWRKNIGAIAVPFFFLVLGSGISDYSCSHILKPIFGRERPFASLERVYYYTPEGKFVFLEKPINKETRSFPSCHATNAGFLTVYTFFLRRQTLFLTLPTAILIGLSRVYLGHHFPFDVLGGFFFGSILGIFLGIISGRIRENYGRRL
ncbi:MAG: phosphatase PAP2 family protein [Thermodesulfobacterium sp.]|jgi:undecaprenyl-diphosphatase|nr:phosphatase PAP2 family protein [Thermodesulfobacterium sp.]